MWGVKRTKIPPFIEFELFINTIFHSAQSAMFTDMPEKSGLYEICQAFLELELPKDRIYILRTFYKYIKLYKPACIFPMSNFHTPYPNNLSQIF